MMSARGRQLTVIINESFSAVSVIQQLRSLPMKSSHNVLYFSFTLLPPSVSLLYALYTTCTEPSVSMNTYTYVLLPTVSMYLLILMVHRPNVSLFQLSQTRFILSALHVHMCTCRRSPLRWTGSSTTASWQRYSVFFLTYSSLAMWRTPIVAFHSRCQANLSGHVTSK